MRDFSYENADREEHVEVRNKAAVKIAKKYGLKVIDLHTPTFNSKELLTDDGVHYTSDGYKIIASEILKSVSEFVEL